MSSFSTKFIKVSEPSPNVVLVEFARPPVNVFNPDVWTQYSEVFDKIANEGADVRAIVVTSALPKIFCAGIDLPTLENLNDHDPEPARRAIGLRKYMQQFQHCITAPERCPVPVIVAVSGPVLGLGVDIVSACDIRYAASDAVFSMKEVDVGLAPDVGTLAFLPKITGNSSLARELVYTARDFTAAEAQTLGFVSRIVDGGRDEVVQAALDLAKVIASKSPIAVLGAKRLLNHSRDHSVAENLDYTAVWNPAMLQTSDLSDSVKAQMEKPRRRAEYRPIRSLVPGPSSKL